MAGQGRWEDISGGNRALQDSLEREEPRIVAAYGLVGAILVLGAMGYGLDRWLSLAPWGLVSGLLLGIAIGFCNLVSSLRRP